MKLKLRARYFEGTVVCEFKPVSSDRCPLCYSSLAPKSKSHLLENHRNYQLELLREDCFYSLHFFFSPKNVPNARSPKGTSAELKPRSSMEKLRLTQVKTYCLMVPGSPCQNLKSSLVELRREAVPGWAESRCLRSPVQGLAPGPMVR